MNKPLPAHISDLLEAVHSGLSQPQKMLPCRFFYDLEGSLLFESICKLPEYYLTRTEDLILRQRANEIVSSLPQVAQLVELGSGSAQKTRRLIEEILHKQPSLHYLPVEISHEMLEQTVSALSREYPQLKITPVIGEYAQAMARLRIEMAHPALILFLGSNLGNFDLSEATIFLKRMRQMMAPEDRALIGLDLKKDPALLEAAYNDSQGITAQFNLNILRRINRELGGNFILDNFEHHAFYNQQEGRIEMHLISKCSQTVVIAGRTYQFENGETIHTENSYKYSLPQIRQLASAAGLDLVKTWQDSKGFFSTNLLAPITQ